MDKRNRKKVMADVNADERSMHDLMMEDAWHLHMMNNRGDLGDGARYHLDKAIVAHIVLHTRICDYDCVVESTHPHLVMAYEKGVPYRAIGRRHAS